jgi:hypothetical protein
MNTNQQHAGLIGRTLRRIGFDRNSMRRGSDRLQAILRAALLAAFLIAGPLAASSFSHHVFAAGMQTSQAQAAAWQRVPAVVVHVTLVATAWRHPTLSGPARLSVRWAAPDGASRTGRIASASHAAVGSAVTVWIDRSGLLAHPPLTRSDKVDHAIGAAAATLVVLALLLCLGARAASLALDRYRLARWEADWLTVEPQWTNRR